MKKLQLGVILLFSVICFGQNNYKFQYYKDVMTDKEYILSKQKLWCLENKEKGFVVGLSWAFKKGVIVYEGINVKSVGIGNCVENDDLIILFDDDTKIALKSWNKFNCDGKSYFDLNGSQLKNLTKRIKAIRFQNGRDFSSSTFVVNKEEDKTFFIDAEKSLESQVYEVIDKL